MGDPSYGVSTLDLSRGVCVLVAQSAVLSGLRHVILVDVVRAVMIKEECV